jgi:isopenicillin N synthase-like dioxygenase
VDLLPRHPSYCRPNVWPQQALPQLEGAFKALGSLMVEVGGHLARHMDALVYRETGTSAGLEALVRESPAHKARLLHYYPSAGSRSAAPEAAGEV